MDRQPSPTGESADVDFREEAAIWATRHHESSDVAQRVRRLLFLLDAETEKLRRARTRVRHLESMTEQLFYAFVESEANVKRAQAESDEWKRCTQDLQAAYGPSAVVKDEDILSSAASITNPVYKVQDGALWQLGAARDDILATIGIFKKAAPESMLETLGRDIQKLLAEP